MPRGSLPRIPPFELSYGLERHRKVEPDAFMIAPRGERVLVAFASDGEDDACYVCTLDSRGKVKEAEKTLACFSRSLCAGTLLYGVRVKGQDGECSVVCEDVLWLRGTQVGRVALHRKIGVWKELFGRDLPRPPSKRYAEFSLPVWTHDRSLLQELVAAAAYPCRGVLGYSSRGRGMRPVSVENLARAPRPEHAVLVARAEIAPDSYVLLARDPGVGLVEIGRAAVPGIAASVMLNNMFRTIKENGNLDLLEESDDDEEFELVDESRFVDLKRRIPFRCVFNTQSRAWQPVEAAGVGEPVTEVSQLSLAGHAAAGGFSAPSTHGESRRPQKKRRRPRRSPASQLHGAR